MITDIRTVGVAVTDQDASVAFFVDVLGFEKRMDEPIDESSRWVEVAAPDATTSLALISGPGAPAAGDTGVRFVVPDAAAEHRRLADAGVSTGELLGWEGVPPMFTFDDPDGNRYDVVAEGVEA